MKSWTVSSTRSTDQRAQYMSGRFDFGISKLSSVVLLDWKQVHGPSDVLAPSRRRYFLRVALATRCDGVQSHGFKEKTFHPMHNHVLEALSSHFQCCYQFVRALLGSAHLRSGFTADGRRADAGGSIPGVVRCPIRGHEQVKNRSFRDLIWPSQARLHAQIPRFNGRTNYRKVLL
jgi:hypothetical protein